MKTTRQKVFLGLKIGSALLLLGLVLLFFVSGQSFEQGD